MDFWKEYDNDNISSFIILDNECEKILYLTDSIKITHRIYGDMDFITDNRYFISSFIINKNFDKLITFSHGYWSNSIEGVKMSIYNIDINLNTVNLIDEPNFDEYCQDNCIYMNQNTMVYKGENNIVFKDIYSDKFKIYYENIKYDSFIITYIAVMTDNKRIVLGLNDGAILIYDLINKKIIEKIKYHDRKIKSIIVTPDNNILVYIGKCICIYNVELNTNINLTNTFNHYKIVLSSDNNKLFSCSSEKIAIWDLKTGELIREIQINTTNSYYKYIIIALSNDNNNIVCTNGNMINIYDIKTGELFRQLIYDDIKYFTNLEISSSYPYNMILTTHNNNICIIDYELGTVIHKLINYCAEDNDFYYSNKIITLNNNNTLLVYVDHYEDTIRVWDILKGENIIILKIESKSYSMENKIYSIEINYDNSLLLIGSCNKLIIVEIDLFGQRGHNIKAAVHNKIY